MPLEMLVATIALLGLAVAALVAVAAARDGELMRIASELDAREGDDSSRVTLVVRSRGLVALAGAVNRTLDRESERRVADLRARSRFQQDLASLSHDIRTPLAGAQGYLQLAGRTDDAEERERLGSQGPSQGDGEAAPRRCRGMSARGSAHGANAVQPGRPQATLGLTRPS